jgi:serine/threonine protein kinase
MQRIGAYRILEELGRGGMGVVYRGHDPAINRLVAVKVIRLVSLTNPDEKAFLHDRLIREARAAGGLSHPRIVTIYRIGQEGERAFMVMGLANFVGYIKRGPSRQCRLRPGRGADD